MSKLKFLILAPFLFLTTCSPAQNCKDTAVIYKFTGGRINYPKTALDANIQGIVIIKFDLDSTCSIVNRRVFKGIGYGCDEEAIKLFDATEKKLKADHSSKCCPLKDIKVPVKFKIDQ